MTTPDNGSYGDEEPTRPLPPPGHYPPPGQQVPPQQGWAPPGAYPYGPYGANPSAPYGYHPTTGAPFSDKSKLVAGLLQIFLPFGIGRFYMGQNGLGVAQLLVTFFTCGIGSLWSFIDGILILINGGTDQYGRPLRDGT